MGVGGLTLGSVCNLLCYVLLSIHVLIVSSDNPSEEKAHSTQHQEQGFKTVKDDTEKDAHCATSSCHYTHAGERYLLRRYSVSLLCFATIGCEYLAQSDRTEFSLFTVLCCLLVAPARHSYHILRLGGAESYPYLYTNSVFKQKIICQ